MRKNKYRPHNSDAVDNLSWFENLSFPRRNKKSTGDKIQPYGTPLQKAPIAYFCGERDILHPRKLLELYKSECDSFKSIAICSYLLLLLLSIDWYQMTGLVPI